MNCVSSFVASESYKKVGKKDVLVVSIKAVRSQLIYKVCERSKQHVFC